MSHRRTAALLIAFAFVWLSAEASALFRARGLLATYDLPTHLHLATVQMRDPSGLWDDDWYAGYPTYAYPPLAHRVAAEVMRRLGPETGFKSAVFWTYVASAPVVYAGARVVAGLPPVPAAAATALVALSPALFRGLLFGQFPSLMAFLFFWAALAALFGALRADRFDPRLAALGALLIGALGSVHLFPLLVLALVMAPLLMFVPVGRLIRRLGPPTLAGVALALLPSLPLLVDFDRFSKTPIPHITRTVEMVRPDGLLEWILFPAGLPMVLGLLVLVPGLAGGRRGIWTGALLVGALLLYLRDTLPVPWILLALVFAVFLARALGRLGQKNQHSWRTGYLAVAGFLSLWLALGPIGGLARLIPLADVLVYDRSIMFGAPFGFFAITRALWTTDAANGRHRTLLVALGLAGIALLGLSVQRVVTHNAVLVPGAQGPFPQGTAIPTGVLEYLRNERGPGRILPLGLPPLAYVLPELTGRPLIDGNYNDARQLTPLRRSGVETLGYEKFIYPALPFTRFFLDNAEAYGIRWVVTGDRHYDEAIPLDRFTLVLESGEDPERSIRIYRSVSEPGQAWEGALGSSVSNVATLAADRLGPFRVGGGLRELEQSNDASALHLAMHGSATYGWAVAELDLTPVSHPCNQIAFRAWSPTGASLALMALRQGTWLPVRPELPLPSLPAALTFAIDCGEISRLQFRFTGAGVHQIFMSHVVLRQVRSSAAWVPLERAGPECFRVTIPHSNSVVTVNRAYFPRWSALDPDAPLRIGSNDLGLLTVQGPAGTHDLCLAFPQAFRVARTLVPGVFVGLSALLLGLIALRPPAGVST